MSLLSISNLSKKYGSMTVVDNVSIDLDAGTALGIIGPNGAGKTTLFNLIAGTVKANSGTVLFEGKDITTTSSRSRCRAGIARSFQIPHPFVGMTSYENVLIGAVFGQVLNEREASHKAMTVLERTGLLDKANTLAADLTLLDRKRLELARALATAPKLLLLDEIAGGLTDPECVELIELIKEILAEGITIVWIEHVVHALLAVVDRIAVLNFGKKFVEGEPEETIAHPDVVEIYMGIEGDAEPI